MSVSQVFDEVFQEFLPTFEKDTAKKLQELFHEHGDEIMEWFEKRIPTNEEIKAHIDKIIEKTFSNASKEEKEKHRKHLEDVYIKGMTHADVIGLDQEFLDGLFSMGYYYYNHGKYKEAQTFFCYLTFLNDKESKYFFSAASAFHMQKDYGSAIAFYRRCTSLDWKHPMPWYYLTDCYWKIQDYPNAVMSIQHFITRAKHDEKYHTLCERAEILHKRICDDYEDFISKWEAKEEK